MTFNAPSSRYEPTAVRVKTGLSQDPLNQVPGSLCLNVLHGFKYQIRTWTAVPVSDTFRKVKGGEGPVSTDTLGLGPKSPLVKAEGAPMHVPF